MRDDQLTVEMYFFTNTCRKR